jgi:hypothetical protein
MCRSQLITILRLEDTEIEMSEFGKFAPGPQPRPAQTMTIAEGSGPWRGRPVGQSQECAEGGPTAISSETLARPLCTILRNNGRHPIFVRPAI